RSYGDWSSDVCSSDLDVGKELKQNPRKAGDVIYGFFTSKGYTMSRETFSKAMANVEVDVGFPTNVRTYLQQIAEGLLKEKKISEIGRASCREGVEIVE